MGIYAESVSALTSIISLAICGIAIRRKKVVAVWISGIVGAVFFLRLVCITQ